MHTYAPLGSRGPPHAHDRKRRLADAFPARRSRRRRAGLDVIAITDHDTIEGARRAADHAARRTKLQVIVGEEVSSRDGHIIGLFLEHASSRDCRPRHHPRHSRTGRRRHRGAPVLAHAATGAQRKPRARGWLAGGGARLRRHRGRERDPRLLSFQSARATPEPRSGAAELGGSDAHIVDAVGRAFTEFPGKTRWSSARRSRRGRRARGAGVTRPSGWFVRGLGAQPPEVRGRRLAHPAAPRRTSR